MTAVAALDVNETLSDMSLLGSRLEEVGASGDLLATWFASTLRDGFALTSAGAYASFSAVAEAALISLLTGISKLTVSPGEAASYVVSGMSDLPAHPDVRPGLEALHDAGIRIVTLTNGSTATAQALLERCGAAQYVEQFLSVEQVGRWKPASDAYRHAVDQCRVRPEDVMLVAVHPWDVDGAKRAGLRGAWINRRGGSYPDIFRAPDIVCPDLIALGGLAGA
jgi:2-haloacid dehalogenase